MSSALLERLPPPALPGLLTRHFHRLELKYLVRGSSFAPLIKTLAYHLAPDPMADADGGYLVSSLYYDTPSFAIYHSRRFRPEVEDGVKLRVRVYGDQIDGESPAMVELKGKDNGATVKERLSLPLADAYRLTGGLNPVAWEDEEDAALAAEIAYFSRKIQLRPAIAIQYKRWAFVGKGRENGLRVTIDQNLGCRAPHLRLDRPGAYRRFLPRDWSVLELKISGEIPDWIDEVLSRYAQPRRVSKYVAAMDSNI